LLLAQALQLALLVFAFVFLTIALHGDTDGRACGTRSQRATRE